ncbi:Hsp20/alpha crystallin family protein [Levilactobacillus bambusae]|uniref:Hsp20/alpha crystallin family protein n=1 Tax=Levilactobacillus bambusae TaxID=2024736 RepID=A0A2V1N1J3_9LACO|nr:Hsp20/alpha crystallin family protein [Levilactobacillus bambusae]PWG00255.1 Hsp20/alpha crystallin family protein [Levilactobacillus bambusae]
MANDLSNGFFSNFAPQNLFDEFNHAFKDLDSSATMKTDIVDHDDRYVVKVNIPGAKKDNIHIDYRDDTLRISASYDVRREDKDDQGNVLRSERNTSNTSRSFYLPDADKDQAKATFEDGVLELTLPKIVKDTDHDDHISIQ